VLAAGHRRLARVVSALLVPGGRLYFRELHPVLFTLDDERHDEELVIRYPYFNTAEPQSVDSPTTYDNRNGRAAVRQRYVWNHALGEVGHRADRRRPADHQPRRTRRERVARAAVDGADRHGQARPAHRPRAGAAMYTVTAVKDAAT